MHPNWLLSWSTPSRARINPLESCDQDSAELDKLLTALASTNPKNALKIQAARGNLQEFGRRTQCNDLKAKADAAVQASIAQAATGFAAHFSEVTKQADDVTSTFKAATKLANEGQEDLVLNRINNYLNRTIKRVEAVREAVEALRDLGKIDPWEAEAAIEKIEAVAETWKKLQKASEV